MRTEKIEQRKQGKAIEHQIDAICGRSGIADGVELEESTSGAQTVSLSVTRTHWHAADAMPHTHVLIFCTVLCRRIQLAQAFGHEAMLKRQHSIQIVCSSLLAGLDEEDERALWLALLSHASVRSLQAVGILTQEQEMLAMMLRRADEDVDAAQRAAQGAVSCAGSFGP